MEINLFAELSSILPEDRIAVTGDKIERHGRDFSHHAPHTPKAVIFPTGSEEITEILRFASKHGVPVVPFGCGSSLEGHAIPLHGGISLDCSLMNNILEVRPNDFIARVEPGVTHRKLNAALKEYGLFFPINPGWEASIGGMAATNASSTNAVRYGAMRNQVLGFEVAQADGNMMRTGGMTVKSSAGYDLTSLFVGSEGTLGVFTEITLRLYPIPECVLAARAVFPSIEAAGRAAIAMIGSGIQIGRIELVDARTVGAVNSYKGTGYTVAPTLLLEFSGTEVAVRRDVEIVRKISESENCTSFEFDSDEAKREQLWEVRSEVVFAMRQLYGQRTIATDACVPISELPEALCQARNTVESYGLEGAILGHVGDGNYHALLPIDSADTESLKKAEAVHAEIVYYALARGGTCTGEHGIGYGKVGYLREERADSLPFMRGIKDVADPKGILNPGKIFSKEE